MKISYDSIRTALMAPLSPKNLRLSAILIAIYQVLTAHVALFLALLGLAHAKQMRKMLEDDIADQDDLGAYYEFRPYRNEVSLFSASILAQVTEFFLYVATAVASIYFAVCLGLFFGVFKSRPCLIVPWLVFDLTWAISRIFLIYYGQDEKFVYIFGGKVEYWAFWTVYTIFDLLIWYIAYSFYINLREVNKLTEIATVAIPCPAPGMAPYHFRRENMHLGSNGYKHILYDADIENPKI
ncbi:uncharacterized protein LOC129609316 [Condylostylus longicornis]|uniref:uncharacterized protein LOC129609316 n=1 Tax=Condylostylus longicornis TaxID=2530218 RepID=UPI00244DECE2|nr:uncharacterized protein LOC129609316 [Condylostylus longicornis]